MLSFLSANLGTIAVAALLAWAVTAIVRKLIRDKRSGVCSGCHGCSGCEGARRENRF